MNIPFGRLAGTGAVLIGTAALLAACGSSGSPAAAPAPSTSASSSGAANPATNGTAGGTGRLGPAASGKIAAISGTTVQVQSQQSGQVAVVYNAKTKFSQTVSTTLSKIKKGDCVTAVAPSGTSSSATSFTASRITVTASVNGACTGGFGGGQRPGGFPAGGPGGAVPSGVPTGFPSGRSLPSNLPSGVPSGRQFPGGGNIGAIASGQVTSVSGAKLVVASRQFNSTTSKSVTVSVGGSTKLTTTAPASAKALKVGKCVTAQGSTDSSGSVKADRIQLDAATNGQCTTGFGGPGVR